MRLISGMHRSGTSLVARLFYEAGANMGDPDSFYRPDEWNPDGYFEQPDIHAINMPLINGIFGRLSYFWLPSTDRIMKRASSKTQLIRDTAQKYDDKLVKETRFCLTLPAWLANGAKVERILVCLREPIAVARSIQKRNHNIIAHGFYLWELHNRRLEENSVNIPKWYINYHNLLNPETQFEELKNAFTFMGYPIEDSKLEELLQCYVKTSMNHNPVEAYAYPTKLQILWDELLSRHANQSLKESV
jgi:hypothetical protein